MNASRVQASGADECEQQQRQQRHMVAVAARAHKCRRECLLPASSYMLVWVGLGVNVGAAVAATALVSFRELMRGINWLLCAAAVSAEKKTQ